MRGLGGVGGGSGILLGHIQGFTEFWGVFVIVKAKGFWNTSRILDDILINHN